MGRKKAENDGTNEVEPGALDNIHTGDATQALKAIQERKKLFHMILTDPPYFLDGLDLGWRKGSKEGRTIRGPVRHLPPGMRFDSRQGQRLQEFMQSIGPDLLALLPPGGFCLMFSQPRLVHRMAVGLEEAGFEIRDMYAWRYTRKVQQKAARQEHWVKRSDRSEHAKKSLIRLMDGRRTAQLRPNFDPIIVAQRPREGTLAENYADHQVGLVDVSGDEHGETLSTVFTVEKEEKARYNGHLTVKPVKLLERLIRIFTTEGQVVLDPFMGSGSTAIAAQRQRRHWSGVERRPDYVEIARQRLTEESDWEA